MNKVFRFTCTSCGEAHEGAPSFAYDAPVYYGRDDPDAELNSDFCVIKDQHFFVRTVLEIPIHDYPEPFTWGVWVSLSRESFGHYMTIFEDEDRSAEYFGWFSNCLPYYPDTLNLKAAVHTRPAGLRPWLELEATDHPLAIDYRDGIAWDRAVEIARIAMHGHGS